MESSRRPRCLLSPDWALRHDGLIYNHITAKLPSGSGHFLINPFGLLYTEITASCFYTLHLDGKVVSKPEGEFGKFQINPAGFALHSPIHGARADLGCVIHTRARAGTAISALKEGILPLTQTSMRFYNAIGFHDYEEPTVDNSERDRIVRDIGQHSVVILRDHGLIACGPTVPDAWNLMYWLESACKVQMDVLVTGRAVSWPNHKLATTMATRYGLGGNSTWR